MTLHRIAFSFLLSAAACRAAAPPRSEEPERPPLAIQASPVDAEWVPVVEAGLLEGRRRIEAFFGRPFLEPYRVTVFPERAQFDAYSSGRWKTPASAPWMVAAGVADHLLLLSPRAWRAEAAEHDPDDEAHVRELLCHELVHVYHGQHNPRRDFEGLDPLGWFVEGLATLVSGQLERSHRGAAREALAAGAAPTRLEDAGSGRYRYGVSGSLVGFVEHRYGREMLWRLLAAVSEEEALSLLGTSEEELLAGWRDSVAAGG